MPQNFYELVWIFIIYAFIGWCTEVAYAALNTGKFVNRGFLNGPYCPIYGCGVVVVVMILTPIKERLLILFLGSVLLTTALEYITGFILEKAFRNKWWDYSDKPFNIQGYVCLKFSIYWGLACTFIMDVIHPAIYQVITWIPYIAGVIIVSILMCVFVVDCCITVSIILKFNKRLRIMDEMGAMIHKLSDEIGENIYENVAGVLEKSEEFQEKHSDFVDKLNEAAGSVKGLQENTLIKLNESTEAAKAKIAESTRAAKARLSDTLEAKKRERDELGERYDRLFEEKNFGFKRLIKAFPDMKSKENDDTLQKVKLHFNLLKRDGDKQHSDYK